MKKVLEMFSPLVDAVGQIYSVTQSLPIITKGTPTFNNQAHLCLDLQIYTKCISEETPYIAGIVTLTSAA